MAKILFLLNAPFTCMCSVQSHVCTCMRVSAVWNETNVKLPMGRIIGPDSAHAGAVEVRLINDRRR
eukprot:scaffold10069_cov17-Tisochrysis_lutea.AAC.1